MEGAGQAGGGARAARDGGTRPERTRVAPRREATGLRRPDRPIAGGARSVSGRIGCEFYDRLGADDRLSLADWSGRLFAAIAAECAAAGDVVHVSAGRGGCDRL